MTVLHVERCAAFPDIGFEEGILRINLGMGIHFDAWAGLGCGHVGIRDRSIERVLMGAQIMPLVSTAIGSRSILVGVRGSNPSP